MQTTHRSIVRSPIAARRSLYPIWAIALTIGTTVLLGLMRLPEPLWGDQALFLVGGQAIRDGALLYRDFWDLKQPGIYGLYALAGSLFGFSGVGAHLVDCLWMGTLALVLRSTLKHRFQRPGIADLLPWLCVGTYFAVIDSRQQMQVESLVGLPIYLAIWCNLQAAQQPEKRWRWLMLSGIAGGVVLLFKLVYLPLLCALWLVYLGDQIRRSRRLPWGVLGQSAGWPIAHILWQTTWPLAIGLMLPLLPVMGYWAATQTLDIAFYTQFQHPPKMLQGLPAKPIKALIMATGWAVVRFFPLLLLAGYALAQMRQRLNLLTMQLVVWLGLGLAMIVAQGQSWWTYHFLLLLVPVSILAADGLDRLLAVRQGLKQRLARRMALVCVSWLALLNLWAIGDMGHIMTRSGLPLTPASQLQYQLEKSSIYRELFADVAFLKQPDALSGPIYVIGNPVFHLLSQRSQAVPLIGWIPEMLLPEQWQQLAQQLTVARPNYLYIATGEAAAVDSGFSQYLAVHYRPVQHSPFGIGYAIKPHPIATH
jgi:Dolichyl-phosphate-mannose-protein mannosyltransferase